MSLEHGVFNHKILIMKITSPTIGDKLNGWLHIHILKYYVDFTNSKIVNIFKIIFNAMEKFRVYYYMEAETGYKQHLKHDFTFVGKTHKKIIRMLIVANNRGRGYMDYA